MMDPVRFLVLKATLTGSDSDIGQSDEVTVEPNLPVCA
jgi:hypothetical protein